jgi:hypothetical protein
MLACNVPLNVLRVNSFAENGAPRQRNQNPKIRDQVFCCSELSFHTAVASPFLRFISPATFIARQS